jgi:4-hydroxy-tetrahydrodipicolinate synthase
VYQQLEGINTALVTPMDGEGRVDEEAFARLVEDQLAAGIHGLAVNGSTGEMPSLSKKERHRNVEIVTDIARGRAAVIVGIGALTTREAMEYAEHALGHGAATGLLICPWYEPMSEREIKEHVRAVASVGLPLMIYNIPSVTGWSMSPELIAELAENPEVRYLKDTTGNAERIFRIKQLLGDRLEILNGQDSLALLGFLAGTRGAIWGAGNATPHACIELWRLTVAQPDVEAARRLWDVFYPVNRFFETEGYIAAVKAATSLRGIEVGPPRRPYLPLEPDRVQELAGLLERLNAHVGAMSVV